MTKDPHATFTFDNDASVKISLEFRGNWSELFGFEETEQESRENFAKDLFLYLKNLFEGKTGAEGSDDEAA